MPRGSGSNLIVIKYDASKEQDAFELAKELQTKHTIAHVDIVVPNAGMLKSCPLVKDVTRADMTAHIELNTYSVISMYQAFREMLERSTKKPPVFAPVGSEAGGLS